MLLHHKNGYRNSEYPETVKKFAITLQFYSAQAYRFIRKFIKLPHPRTIRKWAQNIDGSPGFTEESFNKIKSIVDNSDKQLLGKL